MMVSLLDPWQLTSCLVALFVSPETGFLEATDVEKKRGYVIRHPCGFTKKAVLTKLFNYVL